MLRLDCVAEYVKTAWSVRGLGIDYSEGLNACGTVRYSRRYFPQELVQRGTRHSTGTRVHPKQLERHCSKKGTIRPVVVKPPVDVRVKYVN